MSPWLGRKSAPDDQALVPVEHADRPGGLRRRRLRLRRRWWRLRRRLDRHDRGRVGPGNPRHEHAHQAHDQFVVVGCPGQDLGQACEDFDARIGILEADLAQLPGAVGVLLGGLRGVDGEVHPLRRERERGLADDEMLAGLQGKARRLLAAEIDGVAGRGELGHVKLTAQPVQAHVLPGDVGVPGHRPTPRRRPSTIGRSSGSGRRQRCCGSMPWAMRSGMFRASRRFPRGCRG